jgi:hypothetical protein
VRIRRQGKAAGTPHGGPVVSKCRATDEADLVVLAVLAAMRPGEPVRAQFPEKLLEELDRHGWSGSFTTRGSRGQAARVVGQN